MIGVVGHNGAGKTTFSRALCGLHKDCDGQFLWESKPIERKERLQRSYMVMQDVNYELYPSDRFTFSSHGYDLHIENELVADAFAGLSVQEQSILILHFVLDLPDQEVGHLVGMSRSAVQRRRAKSLTELRIKLATLMPKGG